jgi:hypothetical protein
MKEKKTNKTDAFKFKCPALNRSWHYKVFRDTLEWMGKNQWKKTTTTKERGERKNKTGKV